MNSAWRLPLGGIILVGLGALAGVATHHFLQPSASIRPSAFVAPPARTQAQAPERVIPTVLPGLALPDTSGAPHRLSDWSGHPLVVNFWATWCEPCRREIPLLIRLRHDRGAGGLQIVGVAVDFRAAVVKYVKNAGIDYPILVAEDEGLAAVNAFGMDVVFPFSVFADAGGRVVAVKVGELHRDEADFILDRVQDIDGGKLRLAAAQDEIRDALRGFAVERAKHP